MHVGVGEFFADATDDNSKVVSWTMPAGRFVDALPLLVVTTASLRKGRALHPDGVWEARRFRPNIVIDVDDEGWVEDQWCGRAVDIGTAVVQPVVPCERCTMVTRASARDRACRRRGHAQRLTVAVAMQRARRNCPQRWPPN